MKAPSLLTLLALLVVATRSIAAEAVDLYLDFEGGNDGDAITVSLLNATTHQEPGFLTWTLNQGHYGDPQHGEVGSLDRFTLEVLTTKQLPGPVTVNGTTYTGATHTRAASWNLQSRNKCFAGTFGSSHAKVRIGCYFMFLQGWDDEYVTDTLGPSIWGAGGEYGVLNGAMENGVGRLNAHTSTGGPVEAEHIPVVAAKWYWLCMMWDKASLTFKVGLYDPDDNFSEVGISDLAIQDQLSTFVEFGDTAPDDGMHEYDLNNLVSNIIISADPDGTFPLLPRSTTVGTLTTGTLNVGN